MVRSSMIKIQRAFSLVEMMVVLVIIGILVSLSFPAYQQYRIRTHRVDVQAHMMNIALRLEEYRSIHHSYGDASLSALGFAAHYPEQGKADYQLKLDIESGAWLLSAIPLQNAGQYGDGNVVMNHLGQRCWQVGQGCIPNASSAW